MKIYIKKSININVKTSAEREPARLVGKWANYLSLTKTQLLSSLNLSSCRLQPSARGDISWGTSSFV